MNETLREYHPAANIFPMMDGAEYEALRDDIAANGLMESVWLDAAGRILDGRNRHRACIDLGIEPRFQTYAGNSPIAFVVSLNLKRRHLTSSQAAAISLDVLPMLEEEARARMSIASANKGVEIIPHLEQGKAREHAAAMFGTNARYVQDAKALKEEAPDLFEQVRGGALTIPQAKRELNRRAADELTARPVPLPVGRYSTVVVDPPWPIEKIEREVAPNQYAMDYPTMSLEQIAAWRGVDDIAADDAHLFLWTTQKYLPAAFDILREWQFRYVFTMVWHKPGGFQPFGLPQYNAEFVVYGRRGSPQFVDLSDFMACFAAPRAGHSVKPAAFYETLARVCPGPRIEMFARQARAGFDIWGNEANG